MSGLSHTPGKRTWGYTHRGFESRLFRQNWVHGRFQRSEKEPLKASFTFGSGAFFRHLKVKVVGKFHRWLKTVSSDVDPQNIRAALFQNGRGHSKSTRNQEFCIAGIEGDDRGRI